MCLKHLLITGKKDCHQRQKDIIGGEISKGDNGGTERYQDGKQTARHKAEFPDGEPQLVPHGKQTQGGSRKQYHK